MSRVSTRSSGSQNMAYEAPLTAEEVHCILLLKLGMESKNLDDHAKKVENTQPTDPWKDITRGSDAAEILRKFKNNVYEAMKAELQNQQASSFHSLDRYLEEKVTRSLKEHCDRNEALISELENDIESIQRLTNLANNRAKALETNLREKQEKEKMSKEELEAEFKKKQELVERKHRKLVRAVRAVTSEVNRLRHRDLDQILGTLLEKSFSSNAYIDVEEGWEELVEFLLRTQMVVMHPDDKSKIRLVDFI